MNLSESYTELINRGYSRACTEGCQPYPVQSMEIFLLDHARYKAQQKELNLFEEFQQTYDWQLSRKQYKGYLKSIQQGQTLVLTDRSNTIVWASQSFLTMTGYTPSEVIGRKPGMLQGQNSDAGTLNYIREHLRRAESVKADLVNYRKNGEPYLCRLSIDPLRNSLGDFTHFLAVEYALEG